ARFGDRRRRCAVSLGSGRRHADRGLRRTPRPQRRQRRVRYTEWRRCSQRDADAVQRRIAGDRLRLAVASPDDRDLRRLLRGRAGHRPVPSDRARLLADRRDRRGDAHAGKRTLPVRLARETVVAGYAAAVIAAFVLIAVGAASGMMPRPSVLALAAAPMALSVHRGLRQFYDDPYALMPAMAR